jgi:aspartate aminotransferase
MTTVKPSEWAASMKGSPTIAIHAQVMELIEKGIKVHNFGIGELQPEILVPDVVKSGVIDAINHNKTHYVSSFGDSELLQALSDDFLANFQLHYSPKQFVICSGPKDAVFKACLCVLSPNAKRNQTVVFTPVFESFENVPFLLTGKAPIKLKTDENFFPIVEDLKTVLETDDSIALIIFNSPNNPSGAVYPSSLLESLSNVIKQYPHIAVVFDEVYRTITYDHSFTNIAKYLPEQTLVVGGASKEAACTGVRVGYVAGPEALIKVINKIQGNASSCVTLPTQKGYARLLREDKDMKIRYSIRDKLKERRDHLIAAIKRHTVLSCLKFDAPMGAFYLFSNVEALYGKTRPDNKQVIDSDEDVSKFLLDVGRVVTIPGSSFGTKGHIRVAYAQSLAAIDDGITAFADAVAQLK